MTTDAISVLALLVLGYAVVSGRVSRGYVTPALIFLAIGVVVGPHTLDLVDVHTDAEGFKVIAELALTLILFNQAAKLNLRTLSRKSGLPGRLLLVSMPLTVALGTGTALLILPALPFWEAVCVAIIVAPTEAALVKALLEDRRIPERVRDALSVESGLYDGIALAFLLIALGVVGEEEGAPGHWGLFVIRTVLVSLAVGVAIGFAGGKVLTWTRARGWMTQTWAQLAIVALAIFCFGAGEELHGSGFVAAFAAGLVYATVVPKTARPSTDVAEASGEMLELVVFALFGAVAVVPAFEDLGWRVILFSLLALTVVRLVPVALGFARSGLGKADTLFVGWFGPRGIATLVFGLLVLEEGHLRQGALIEQVAVVTVTVSLVLHSLTARPGIHLYCQKAGNEVPAGQPE